eukprot:scaffold44993_cov33-Attheya_sp.AAC.2
MREAASPTDNTDPHLLGHTERGGRYTKFNATANLEEEGVPNLMSPLMREEEGEEEGAPN